MKTRGCNRKGKTVIYGKMNRLGKYIVLLSFIAACLLPLRRAEGQQRTERVCDTIPYEFVRGKIIIPVTVNGRKVKYIVDTGGRTGTVRNEAVEMGAVEGLLSANVSDFNNKGLSYPTAYVKNVQLSPSYQLAQLETMVIPANGFFKELGVAGLLGGDAFARAVVTFDARNRILILNYPYRPGGLKLADGREMFPGPGNHSIVEMNFGEVRKKVLFDTGVTDLLLLCKDDYLEVGMPVEKIATVTGISGIGIGGLSTPVESDKVVVKEMEFGGKHFTRAGTITNPMPHSIIGVEMLEYGKVIIDYMRSRFYFFPYDPETVELGGAPKTWNVGVLPVNDHFEVTTVWENMRGKVEIGEQVTHINDTDMSGIAPSQFEVERILTESGKTTAWLTLKDKQGKVRRIEICKE